VEEERRRAALLHAQEFVADAVIVGGRGTACDLGCAVAVGVVGEEYVGAGCDAIEDAGQAVGVVVGVRAVKGLAGVGGIVADLGFAVAVLEIRIGDRGHCVVGNLGQAVLGVVLV